MFKVISDFAIDMPSLGSVEQVLRYVVKQVFAPLNFKDIVIYQFDEDEQLLIQKAALGDKLSIDDEIINPLKIKLGEGVVGKAAKTQSALLINDTRDSPEYIVDDQSRLSELAVPIVIDGHLLGVLDSEHPNQSFYSEEDLILFNTIASMMAVQMSKLLMVGTLEETIEKLEYSRKVQNSLFSITELIFETKSMEEFYQHLHALVSKLTHANNFYVALLSEDGETFSIKYSVDEKTDVSSTLNEEIPCDGNGVPSITGYTLNKGEPLLVYENDIKRMMLTKQCCIVGTTPKVWLGVPFGNDKFKGIVVVQSYFGGYLFTPKDKRLLTIVAKYISNALERIQNKYMLEFMALHDNLTNLPNRILFMDRVTHAIGNTERGKNNLIAVLFIDLDKFKSVNDTYGHHVGDKLLIEVSKRIQHCLRSSDTLCRLGGDEFAILLENISQEHDIEKIAKNVIASVDQSTSIDDIDIKISASIGVTIFTTGDATCSQLLIEADEAMYKAKELGKNQVCFYQK